MLKLICVVFFTGPSKLRKISSSQSPAKSLSSITALTGSTEHNGPIKFHFFNDRLIAIIYPSLKCPLTLCPAAVPVPVVPFPINWSNRSFSEFCLTQATGPSSSTTTLLTSTLHAFLRCSSPIFPEGSNSPSGADRITHTCRPQLTDQSTHSTFVFCLSGAGLIYRSK